MIRGIFVRHFLVIVLVLILTSLATSALLHWDHQRRLADAAVSGAHLDLLVERIALRVERRGPRVLAGVQHRLPGSRLYLKDQLSEHEQAAAAGERAAAPLLRVRQLTLPDGREQWLVVHPGPRQVAHLLGRPPLFWILAISALLSSLLIAGLVAWRQVRPLNDIQTAARRLAAGDLGSRVARRTARRGDAIGVVAEAFNRMARDAERHMDRERRWLRDVSHDLRSPLARAQLAAAVLVDSEGQERRQAGRRLQREFDQLRALLDQMLDLFRLEAGTAARERRRIDLSGWLRTVLEAHQTSAAAAGVILTFDPDPPVTVMATPALLRRAVDNVLDNALRFTPSGGAIGVTLNQRAETAELAISDSGPGVPEAALARIFDPFHQVDEARSRQQAEDHHSGLGLAISRRVVQQHGGDMRAEPADGGGLRVVIQLPLADSAGDNASTDAPYNALPPKPDNGH